jgi:FecR protein
MKTASKILGGSIAGLAIILLVPAMTGAASKEARVTQIIREVNLLPANADPRAAALNDHVSEETGVRTGGDSRSELTFPDLTITRLGANTIFTFNKSGRTANVDSGSILLRVPKDSGGGSIRSSAITVAITGTTVIFERSPEGQSKLTTLEGTARVALNTKPKEWRTVRAAQMLDVPPGATTLPMPVNIDLDELMRTHPLIVDFKPLPSEPLIRKVVQQTQAPTHTQTPAPVLSPTPRGPGSNPLSPTPAPTSSPSKSPPPNPTPKPTPKPSKAPVKNSPSPTPKATPKPTPNATPKPTPKPTPKSPKGSGNVKVTPTPTQGPVILKQNPNATPKPTPQYKKKKQSGSNGPH